jgi:hypothetical protein
VNQMRHEDPGSGESLEESKTRVGLGVTGFGGVLILVISMACTFHGDG